MNAIAGSQDRLQSGRTAAIWGDFLQRAPDHLLSEHTPGLGVRAGHASLLVQPQRQYRSGVQHVSAQGAGGGGVVKHWAQTPAATLANPPAIPGTQLRGLAPRDPGLSGERLGRRPELAYRETRREARWPPG